ncbi:MAG: GC-type dockerin domain-anchored protein [Phycisphaerales bacterium]
MRSFLLTVRPQAAVAVAALTAFQAVASASPVPWVNIPGPINSRGLYGASTNAVVNAPVMAVEGPWYYLTISGTLNKVASNTQAREACIEVTTPAGDNFIIKPFTAGGFSQTIAVPAGTATTPPWWTFGAGACQLRFFELYADNASGPDATWTNLQITLHDGGNNEFVPFEYSIPVSAENPDTQSAGSFVYQGDDTGDSFFFPHTRVVNKVRVKGYGTAMSGWTSNSTRSPLGVTRYDFTAPRADGNGTVTWTVTPFDADAVSSSGFDMVVDTPVPVRTGQGFPWSYRAYEVDGHAAPGARVASVWMQVQPLTGDAPAATDLGYVRGTPWAPGQPSRVETFNETPGMVKWYRFVTEYPCSPASGYWMDIHSQIPVGSPIADHEMALYSPTGAMLAADDDGGSGNLSMLSFGQTAPVRTPVNAAGGPEPRNGHDGVLTAGEHYLAVAQYDAQFDPTGFFATTLGALTGGITVEFRTNLPPAPCTSADVGSQGGAAIPDAVLDNNDFIAFITLFFNQDPRADLGTTGGVLGSDGQWNNNDFIAFIDRFFYGCI